MKHIAIALLSLLTCLLTTISSHAESYVGGTLGFISLGQTLTNIKGNENLNYPDAPDNTDPTASLLPGARYSNIKFDGMALLGLKAGYYYDQAPNFGIESELLYSRLKFKEQDVTITHPGILAATGVADNFTEDQLPADIDMYIIAINAMYRYQGWKQFTPYIGAGPALYLAKINGTGYSGIVPALGETGEAGPNINQHPTSFGTDLKLGGEYAFTPAWGLGLEYRYNWAAFKVDHFRSSSDIAGDYQSQVVELAVTRHF